MNVEDTIQFNLEQQGGFTARLQQMADVQSRQQGIIDHTLTLIGQLAEAQQRTDEHVRELAEAQLHTDKKLQELAGSQQHTDERLTRSSKS